MQIDLAADAFIEFSFIWFKIYAALYHYAELRKQIAYLFSGLFNQPVKIHLHPWWYTTYERHILADGFLTMFSNLFSQSSIQLVS